ncbi:hypothetical protein [Protofrankia coriariae]|uniref:Secreted protein n=1 Tax=Protofrankia coriariae TaxID=1562887 RepID=A0ABR5F5T9_9ACTN|nr:hypothetical protein [Protofrankia coriariae]KLL12020.1 hypothetical protein FrCorBMG51_07005 [Protofrankia coriariae]
MRRKLIPALIAPLACVTVLIAPAAEASAATWHNTGQSFYWFESCDAAGKAGVNTGRWESYFCNGSSAPWADYDLWVWY